MIWLKLVSVWHSLREEYTIFATDNCVEDRKRRLESSLKLVSRASVTGDQTRVKLPRFPPATPLPSKFPYPPLQLTGSTSTSAPRACAPQDAGPLP